MLTQWWLLSRPSLIHLVENGITVMQHTTVHKHKLLKPEYVLDDMELHFTGNHIANADDALIVP